MKLAQRPLIKEERAYLASSEGGRAVLVPFELSRLVVVAVG